MCIVIGEVGGSCGIPGLCLSALETKLVSIQSFETSLEEPGKTMHTMIGGIGSLRSISNISLSAIDAVLLSPDSFDRLVN